MGQPLIHAVTEYHYVGRVSDPARLRFSNTRLFVIRTNFGAGELP